MASANEPIGYRYLDMDKKCFCETQAELLENYRHKRGAFHRAMPNWKHNQCLMATGTGLFSEMEAKLLCRKISGG